MASLIGSKLQAEYVLNFSGQYSLYADPNTIPTFFYLNCYKDEANICRYYNIVEVIKDTVPILYFYPKFFGGDIRQAMLVKECSNIYSFAFDSAEHGKTLESKELAVVLTQEMDDIIETYKCKMTEKSIKS